MILKLNQKKSKEIIDCLKSGDSVELQGVSILRLRKYKDRMAYHNMSKKKIKIKGWTILVGKLINENE